MARAEEELVLFGSDSFKPISLPLRAQVHTTQERGGERPKGAPQRKMCLFIGGRRSKKKKVKK
jgi:hypothetical protein